MAEGASLPNLNLTPEEKRFYGQLFKAADPDGFQVVSGDVAVKFFERTGLDPRVLGEIWQIADVENRGLLTPAGFGVVLRLIGHVQSNPNQPLSTDLAAKPAPLPKFEGIAASTTPLNPQITGPTPASPTQPTGIRVPPLPPAKVTDYAALFDRSGAQNGFLDGDIAKDIFLKSNLEPHILSQIWSLVDRYDRGSLDRTEFVVAMHLLASIRNKTMPGVPATLSPAVFEAASRLPQRISGPPRSGSAVPAPLSQQFSGQGRPQSPAVRQFAAPPMSAQSTGDGWLVSPAEKARYDEAFATVDTTHQGFVTGDLAVPFLKSSGLADEDLEKIWDLADINGDGILNREKFAVLMFLVRQKRQGGAIPATLPSALVPPSMRRQNIQPTPSTAPVFEDAPSVPPQPQAKSAADDLFGLDAFSAPTSPTHPQVAQSSGSSAAAFKPASPIPQYHTAASSFKPFVPSSSFGQSILPQSTGSPAPQTQARSPPPTDDLLGDADPEVSNKLTHETTELANLSNQIGNLSKQMQEVQTTRGATEQQISQSSQQKREFETRLSQLRTLYEQEVKGVNSLREQLSQTQQEKGKLQHELAILDGTYQDLRTRHQQLASEVESERRESAALKEKLRQMNTEVASLKPAVEKLKSEARQQKGLNAINRKQLNTVEAEKERLQMEHSAAAKELEEAQAEAQSASASPAQATSPPAVTSPAASMKSQNNPFFRRQPTGTSEAGVASPAAPREADTRNAFDSFFGPSFTTSTATPPPPMTSFGNESPAPAVSSIPVEPSPSASPPASTLNEAPRAVDPPAPPAARQMTSSALPFAHNFERSESVSSSVRVAPPASRLGAGETPRVTTPALSTSEAHSQVGSSPVEIERSDVEGPSAYFDQAIPAPAGTTEPSVEPPLSSSHHDIPGAFPSAAAYEETPAQEEAQGNMSHASNAPFNQSFNEPHRAPSPSEKASDFDQAFADFKQKEPVTNGTAATQSNKEFPPIQEIDDDDDEDSDTSEEAPLRFDDDFAAPGPSQLSKTDETPGEQPVASQAAPVESAEPPREDAQNSPPSYSQAVPTREDHFPAEYGDLLPHREDPMTDPPHSVDSATGAPIERRVSQSYGPEIGRSSSLSAKSPPTSAFTKPDFDAAFANMNMGTVAAADDSDDSDDMENSFTAQGHNTDFDPTFDSPAAPTMKTTAAGPSQPTASAFDDFDNFGSSVASSQKPASPAPATGANTSHDWDAIFATLDGPSSKNTPAFPDPVNTGGATEVETLSSGPAPPENAKAPSTTLAPPRPSPGRALSMGTEHDDPILKRLTGMGWSRDESLQALEKYDYNIDKAIDHLTSK